MEQTTYEKLMKEAVNFYKKKNYSDAIANFKQILKQRSDSKARYYIGKCYLYGKGVKQDIKKACHYFEKSLFNYFPAFYGMAMYYESLLIHNMERFDRKDLKDFNKLMFYLKAAAVKGHIESQYKLGQYYSCYPYYDYNLALKWYRRAAERGHILAQYSLGWLYEHGNLYGKKDNCVEAVNWYLQAANKGYHQAMKDLSWLYYAGKDVKRDIQKAKDWYDKVKLKRSRFGNMGIGTVIRNIKTKEKVHVVFPIIYDRNIQCQIEEKEEKNGVKKYQYYINEFGSHYITKMKPSYINSDSFPKNDPKDIRDIKFEAEIFYRHEWRFTELTDLRDDQYCYSPIRI